MLAPHTASHALHVVPPVHQAIWLHSQPAWATETSQGLRSTKGRSSHASSEGVLKQQQHHVASNPSLPCIGSCMLSLPWQLQRMTGCPRQGPSTSPSALQRKLDLCHLRQFNTPLPSLVNAAPCPLSMPSNVMKEPIDQHFNA